MLAIAILVVVVFVVAYIKRPKTIDPYEYEIDEEGNDKVKDNTDK